MEANENTLLGKLLLNEGLVTQEQLDAALQKQKVTQEAMGQILVSMGVLRPQDVASALQTQARLRANP